jgi:hypothetical protein
MYTTTIRRRRPGPDNLHFSKKRWPDQACYAVSVALLAAALGL